MGRPAKNTFQWTASWNQWTGLIDSQRVRLGKDEAEARKQFEFLCRKSGDAGELKPSITLGEIIPPFLQSSKETKTPERLRILKQQLASFVTFKGSDFRVKEMKPLDIEKWINTRTLKPGTQRTAKACVLALLNWAAKPLSLGGGELIAANPVKGQVKLPESESRGAEAIWSEATYNQVLATSNPAFANVVRMLACTGARPNVICKLESRHYNKAMQRLDVADIATSKRKPTKYLKLNQEATELIEAAIKQHPTGRLFRNSFGKPWNSTALQIYLTNLMNKFRHSKDLPWQDGLCVYGLRHTFATAFLSKHPNEIEYLRTILGHADYKMIMKHYSHLVDQNENITKRMKSFSTFGS